MPYVYTTHVNVNPKSLRPRPRETRCRTAQHENRNESLLSEIEAALASEKTWKQVWQCLADDGLDITFETFAKSFNGSERKPRYPHRQGKASNSPACVLGKRRYGVTREPHSHSAHRRIGTRVRLGVALVEDGAGRYSRMMKRLDDRHLLTELQKVHEHGFDPGSMPIAEEA